MKTKEIFVKTQFKEQLIDITSKVEDFLKEAKVKDGICNIYCPHTTAGLIINENADISVKKDILMKLGKIVDDDIEYTHGEGNSAAHIKSSLVGVTLNVPVKDGKLILGTWQGIYFAEFDGSRNRKVVVSIL
jgi:secondary thiamine-phosphate synthase enzyme